MVGSASGALTGLIFVAVQLNRDRIMTRPDLRASAVQTLLLLVIPLAVAAFLLTPGQPWWRLGTEIVVLAVVAAASLFAAGGQHREPSGTTSRITRLLDRRGTNVAATIFLLVAGLSELADYGGGLFWLMPAVIVCFLTGILNAWIFLVAEL